MNLIETFLDEASRCGDRAAIVEPSGAVATFDDLLSRSARLSATWRHRGIRAGDRVMLAMPLGIALYVGLIALWRLGAVVVFPEPALGLRGLRQAAIATKPNALLATGWYQALRYAVPELWPIRHLLSPHDDSGSGEPIEALSSDHPALMSFTSGSTGRPKTIIRSHQFLADQNACVAELLKPEDQDQIDLVAFPVFVLANLSLGVTSVLPSWSLRNQHTADADRIVRLIADQRVTRALLPPSICEKIATARSFARLNTIFTGGGPVFPDLLERLVNKLPNGDVVSVYGSTEAEPIAHQSARAISARDWQRMRDGAGLLAGRPVPQINLEIVADEIIVSGAHVNNGYANPADDKSTKVLRDGVIWHRTADAGRMDESGRLWLLGRLDGRAGELFPFGIEAAARYWPGVKRAALISREGRAVLVIEGDGAFMPDWQSQAARIGDVMMIAVDAIPLDRRHASKIDYVTLRKMISEM